MNGATADVTVQDQTFGTITPSDNSIATYTAPSAAPPFNPIAVSTDFHNKNGGHVILVSNITVGQPPLSGTINASLDDTNGLTIVTTATATFVWNGSIQAYMTSNGHFSVTYDQVTLDCSTHAVGEADISPMDGYIAFAGGIEYFFGGESAITLQGTTTCPGGTTPFTNTAKQAWWPSVNGNYLVRNDGSFGETVTHGTYGESFVDMTWSLSPQM